jgi:hypothetical protein
VGYYKGFMPCGYSEKHPKVWERKMEWPTVVRIEHDFVQRSIECEAINSHNGILFITSE